MFQTSTVEREAARRARAVDLPAAALVDAVRDQLTAKRVHCTYEIGDRVPTLAEVTYYPDIAVWTCKLNVSHTWVADFMLGPEVTAEQRTQMEVVVMTILGVGTATDPAEVRDVHHALDRGRLETAAKILHDNPLFAAVREAAEWENADL